MRGTLSVRAVPVKERWLPPPLGRSARRLLGGVSLVLATAEAERTVYAGRQTRYSTAPGSTRPSPMKKVVLTHA
jgi:hypothetical protein